MRFCSCYWRWSSPVNCCAAIAWTHDLALAQFAAHAVSPYDSPTANFARLRQFYWIFQPRDSGCEAAPPRIVRIARTAIELSCDGFGAVLVKSLFSTLGQLRSDRHNNSLS